MVDRLLSPHSGGRDHKPGCFLVLVLNEVSDPEWHGRDVNRGVEHEKFFWRSAKARSVGMLCTTICPSCWSR